MSVVNAEINIATGWRTTFNLRSNWQIRADVPALTSSTTAHNVNRSVVLVGDGLDFSRFTWCERVRG